MNNNIIPEMAVVGNRCIAAILSSARSEWGKYFSVVESPRLGRRDFQNEVIRRSNLFNICEFDTLFQADLPSNARYELNKNFSPSQVRVVQPLDQILRPNSDKPSLRFRSDNAIEALFQSLRTNQILEVDEAAPSLTISNDFDSEVLVLVEDTEEVGSVVAVNLASYLCAHLKKLPRKSRESVQITDGLYRRFEEEVNYSRKTCIEEQISANLGIDISEFELSHYSYCIIFTSGLLYGAAIKQVPTGHFLVYPDCGLHVLRNIAFSPRLRTALLIDPCSLSHPETADVATNLAERGVYVRILTGKDANAVKVDFSVRELPFDWVIFVAHGGFPKGYRLKVNFSDPNGNEHLLVIRKIDSFTVIHDSDKIRVASFVE
ncbi:MAG: hypothetical protein IIB00_05300, partial [candidate division Zixibacteria bacterium]|nr:hypothetical protein [candidate division Zixibacteria bacterium]